MHSDDIRKPASTKLSISSHEDTSSHSSTRAYAPPQGSRSSQSQWIRVPNSDDEYYWPAPSDGIRWFANTSGMMWYEIDNEAWIIGSQVSEYKIHEGKIKSWNEWNALAFGQTIAFKPNPEWLELPSGSGTKMSSSSSSWRTGHMDNEIKKASTTLGKDFNTGHHKIAKSTIEWLYNNFNESQLNEACKQLDLPKMASLNSFRSLFSNVTLGPDSGNREEDPGQLTDLTTTLVKDRTIERDKSDKRPPLKRTLTPRSLEYFGLNNLVAEMGGPGSKTFDSGVKRPFTDEEFGKILTYFVRAEKKHAIMTKGGGLDTNISMWSEDKSKDEKPWSRKVTETEPVTFEEEDMDKSVRDLKSHSHRAVNGKPRVIVPPYAHMLERRVYFPPPVKEGDTSPGPITIRPKEEYLKLFTQPDSRSRQNAINALTLEYNLHRMLMYKSTTKVSDSWHHGWQYFGDGKWTYKVNEEEWEVQEGQKAKPLNEAAEKVMRINDSL